MKLGLIGYGNIGRMLVAMMRSDPALQSLQPVVLVRPDQPQDVGFVTTARELIDARPDMVIECAGHEAVRNLVPSCLEAGMDTVVASIGALADPDLALRLTIAAQVGGARLLLPAGAIGGIDLLSALQPSGIQHVAYEGRKPPLAWVGSPAEQLLDLHTLTTATAFFTGSARDAAREYPKNANVAATLALAGIGFDATTVTLIADPAAPGNLHSFSVTSNGADFNVQISGKASPDNPRTSVATVYSLLREVRNRLGPVSI